MLNVKHVLYLLHTANHSYFEEVTVVSLHFLTNLFFFGTAKKLGISETQIKRTQKAK